MCSLTDKKGAPTGYRLGASCHWTDEEKSRLTHLYQAGVSIPDMATELDRGQRAIVGKASELKLKRPREVKWKWLGSTWSEPIETFKVLKRNVQGVYYSLKLISVG